MDKAAARPEPELQMLEAVNRCGYDTMCATINAIDAVTTDEVTALLEASATGRGADHATPIAEREHADVMSTPQSTADEEAAARGEAAGMPQECAHRLPPWKSIFKIKKMKASVPEHRREEFEQEV